MKKKKPIFKCWRWKYSTSTGTSTKIFVKKHLDRGDGYCLICGEYVRK